MSSSIERIYTDGSCLDNGRPYSRGGWAALLLDSEKKQEIIKGNMKGSTNNIMELTAAIEGLETFYKRQQNNEDNIKPSVQLITDSIYVKKGIIQWLKRWKRDNWERADNILNVDLWKRLDEINEKINVEWIWAKAHTKKKDEHSVYNGIVDKKARDMATLLKREK